MTYRTVSFAATFMSSTQDLWLFVWWFGAILLVGSILVFACWKPLGSPPALFNPRLAIMLVVISSRIQRLAGLGVFVSCDLNNDHAPRELSASKGRQSDSDRYAPEPYPGTPFDNMSRSWHPMWFRATSCKSKLVTRSQQKFGSLRSHLMQSSIVLYLQVLVNMVTLLNTVLAGAKASQCQSLALWTQRTRNTLKHVA